MENNKELINYKETDIDSISLDQIPSIINNKMSIIQKLDQKIQIAVNNTELAASSQIIAQNAAEKAIEKSKSAKESASVAANKSAKLGHKKEAIEALQSSVTSIADAQTDATGAQIEQAKAIKIVADAQASQMEAIQATQEYQKALTEATRFLFMLGCSNMAANRTVIEVLESGLKDASKSKISAESKKKLVEVVNQLKVQQDMFDRQEKLQDEIEKQAEAINATYNEILEAKSKIESNETHILEQDERLSAGEEKDIAQDALISAQAAKDLEHDKQLAENEKHDAQQDERLSAGEEKDIAQDALIAAQDKRITAEEEKGVLHDTFITDIEKKNADQDVVIAELSQVLEALKVKTAKINNATIAGLVIALISLLIAVIQFFI